MEISIPGEVIIILLVFIFFTVVADRAAKVTAGPVQAGTIRHTYWVIRTTPDPNLPLSASPRSRPNAAMITPPITPQKLPLQTPQHSPESTKQEIWSPKTGASKSQTPKELVNEVVLRSSYKEARRAEAQVGRNVKQDQLEEQTDWETVFADTLKSRVAEKEKLRREEEEQAKRDKAGEIEEGRRAYREKLRQTSVEKAQREIEFIELSD